MGLSHSVGWGMRIPTGEVWRDGCNNDLSITRLQVFLQVFPATALQVCFHATNEQIGYDFEDE
jgi:hypothetical protein